MTKDPRQIDFDTTKTDKEISISDSNSTLRNVIDDIIPVFRTANIFLFLSLCVVFIVDLTLVALQITKPDQRIIDKSVIISLIGATAAQISVLIVAAIKKLK